MPQPSLPGQGFSVTSGKATYLKHYRRSATGGFAVLFMLVLLTLANYRYCRDNPGGSDFVPRWIGTRLLLTEGTNPYSSEGTQAIQLFYYGHPAAPNQDQVLFVYPLYATYVFAPFALLSNFTVARAMWMTVLEAALILMTIIGLSLANWRPAPPVLAGLLIFAMLWYHAVRPLINGNAAILSALFIAAGLLAVNRGLDWPAGILLALASIKPQTVVLLLPAVLLWAYSVHRRRLAISLLASMASLILTAMLIVPDWIRQDFAQIASYPDYTLAGTPEEIFSQWWPAAGSILGWTFTLVLVALLIWQWRLAWGRSSALLAPVAFLTLAATNLIGVRTATSNYIVLFPGLILVFADWRCRWGQRSLIPITVTLVGFLVGLWLLFLGTRSGRMQSSTLFFPLPIFLIVSLVFYRHPSKVLDFT